MLIRSCLAGFAIALAAPCALAQGTLARYQATTGLDITLAQAGSGATSTTGSTTLDGLIADALRANPELSAARSEREAARNRIAPAGALEDPMVEAGFLNVPTTSYRLNREDMTMKMLGVAQKLPFPGKRALREEVAEREAQTSVYGVRETANRVVRDVKTSYYELALVNETVRLTGESRRALEQVLAISQSRYSVGQGTQADVLKAQTQLAKMSEELLRMERERPVLEAELARLTGSTGTLREISAALPAIREASLDYGALRELALGRRPQLLGLRSAIDRASSAMELARKEARPDFEVRAQYGQRENMLDGTRRSDVVSLTMAVNVPIWAKAKIEPKIAEARAMRDQAVALAEAQEHELAAKLRQQVALADQSRKSAALYESTIVPQAELAFDSTLAAYRVGRADLPMLLESQMNVFSYRIGRAGALVGFSKALAEIDWLTGAEIPGADTQGAR